MTRLELLTLLLALEKLLDKNEIEAAKELIKDVIAEARRPGSDKKI